MDSLIKRYANDVHVMRLALVTRAVEYGFIAAGVTVFIMAGIQSLRTVLSWFVPGA